MPRQYTRRSPSTTSSSRSATSRRRQSTTKQLEEASESLSDLKNELSDFAGWLRDALKTQTSAEPESFHSFTSSRGETSGPAEVTIKGTEKETTFETILPDGSVFRGTGQFVDRGSLDWKGLSEAVRTAGAYYAEDYKPEAEPVSFVKMAIEKLHSVLVGKGDQYAGNNEFANFEFQAMVGEQDMRQVFRGAIAQKLAREARQAKMGYDVDDTILDIAGYAVLWFAYDIMRRNNA